MPFGHCIIRDQTGRVASIHLQEFAILDNRLIPFQSIPALDAP
jgi:hypothetical protein